MSAGVVRCFDIYTRVLAAAKYYKVGYGNTNPLKSRKVVTLDNQSFVNLKSNTMKKSHCKSIGIRYFSQII